MFDEFVQNSRSAGGGDANSLTTGGPSRHAGAASASDVGFEDSQHLPSNAITALETGFVSSDVHDVSSLPPIFQLGRVQYAFPAPLALLTVSSNILTMCLYAFTSPLHGPEQQAQAALQRPRLVRINLDQPERTEEAEVPLPPLPRTRGAQQSLDPSTLGPHKMFSDPTSRHLILSMRNGDNYYWCSAWKKARPLPRLKGLVLESVAWNRAAEASPSAASAKRASSAASTREILLGTRNGEIYEAVLVAQPGADGEEGDFLDRLARRTAGGGGAGPEVDRLLRHMFTLPERQAVTGLTAEPFPAKADAAAGGKQKAVIIVTTSTRIYEMVGVLGKSKRDDNETESLYDALFEPYRGEAAPPLRSELPGDLPYSELHMWSSPDRRTPKALAWLTGPGVYHGLLSFADQNVGDSVVDSANLLPYPAVALEEGEASSLDGAGGDGTIAEIPLSIALTEFHFLLLYRERIMGISSLDDRVVFEEAVPLRPHERVIGTAVDPSRKTYWIYTDASIFELVVREEDRDVWRVYLERGAHDAALRYVKTPLQRDAVLSSQGDRFFAEHRFIQAAQCYAQTFTRTFEEIVLSFLDAAQSDALRYYLVMRLDRLRKTDITQRVMLATWLVEIYLSKINELEDATVSEASSQNVDNYKLEQTMIEEELRQFLVTYMDNLDRKTTFSLISKHGRTDILLHYALVIGDHERVVRHWVQEEDWARAIDAINRQPSLDLYYRFAAVLMRNAPSETVDSWARQAALQPRRLIPAMLQHRPKAGEANQTVRYLQHIIQQGSTDAAMHNLLLTQLAQGSPHTSRDAADAALLAFIAESKPHPRTGAPCYDLDYALRTCSANGRQEACVRIYAKMGLFESAVDMALDGGDVELACLCAEMVESDAGLRRKLWLKAARFVVQTKKDIRAAMVFLSRTDLLSIEDILPFFPDFVVIDDFKDEICGALEGYAARIEALKEEMDEASRSADSIRADTAMLAQRFVTVEQGEKCAVCDARLLARQFYVFPCRHSFHADCLIGETTRHLPQRTLRRILELQEQLSHLTSGLIPAPPPSYTAALTSVSRATRRGAVGAAAATVAVASVPLGSLDKLREYILPDAIVGAISAGVSVGVSSGRRVLDPLAATPAELRDRKVAAIVAASSSAVPNGGENAAAPTGATGTVPARKAEEEERIEELRDELDGLVASACVVCDGSVSAVAAPFVGEREAVDEWAL